jgi:inorganic pyrophosphatase/exopolyphosphatase
MFGEKLEFMNDSSFKHTWHFDLASSWTNGKWRISNDTLYLYPILISDTLNIRNSEKKIIKDSIVISDDEISERIESDEYVMSLISGGGQNRRFPPSELFLKNGKLFRVLDNKKLDKGKQTAILTRKKYKTYFRPIKNKIE